LGALFGGGGDAAEALLMAPPGPPGRFHPGVNTRQKEAIIMKKGVGVGLIIFLLAASFLAVAVALKTMEKEPSKGFWGAMSDKQKDLVVIP